MSFLSEVKADCLEAETDLGAKTAIVNGITYSVAATLTRRDTILVIGGQEVEIKLTLRIRWTEGDTLPAAGQRVTFNSVIYRIAQVSNAHFAFLEIACTEVNR